MTSLTISKGADDTVITVIIPVYRDLASLTDTSKSVLECKIPEGFRLELIIANDGGCEKTSKYCESIKVKEVVIKPNRGSYYARNRGVEFSSGAFIGFVDADIFVDKYWIDNAVKHLKEYDYLAGNIRIIKGQAGKVVTAYQQLIDFNTEWHMQALHYGPTANVWVRRSLIETIGGFNEALFSAGDMEFGSRVHATPEVKQLYAEDVIVNHPPRDFNGLLKKSRRLAHGHASAGNAGQLREEFTLLGVLKRFFNEKSVRSLGWKVSTLRIFLFVHRTLYRAFYKIKFNKNEFDSIIKEVPSVVYVDHSLVR
jgi:glycosyltransferase involved in cell wall biosynthesis